MKFKEYKSYYSNLNSWYGLLVNPARHEFLLLKIEDQVVEKKIYYLSNSFMYDILDDKLIKELEKLVIFS